MTSISSRHIAVALVAALLSYGFGGCPRRVPPPDNEIEQPAEMREAVTARTEQFSTGRFKEVVLDYFGKNERVKVRQLILVKQPNNLRVQTRLPGSNEIVSLLVTDGETFALHRREDNEYITGPPTPENINRLLPVDLSARDVVRVMFGGAPWDRFADQPGEPELDWDTKKGRYVYSVETGDGGRLRMQIRHPSHAVDSVTEFGPDDEVVYRYTTDDWERFGNRSIPTWRRFVSPPRDLDFSLDVGETELGVGLPDNLFQLSPPPGSTIRRVDGDMETIEQPDSPDDQDSSRDQDSSGE